MRATPVLRGASGSRRPAGPDVVYALIAAAALGAGSLVYLLDRSPGNVYFLPLAWGSGYGSWFGALSGVLPAFLHVYAFILLTAAVVSARARVLSICLFWLGIDTLFELGQHATLAPALAAALPARFEQIPMLERSVGYFLHGTFDPWDLTAILVGTLAAYCTLTLISRRHARHAPQA